MTTLRHIPASHRRCLERRRARALRKVGRETQAGAKSIADTIAARGDAISDEGREFLESLGKVLGAAAKVMRRK